MLLPTLARDVLRVGPSGYGVLSAAPAAGAILGSAAVFRLRKFERKGVLAVPEKGTDEDTLLGLVLEAGAEDMKRSGEHFEIICDPASFNQKMRIILEILPKTSETYRKASTALGLGRTKGREIAGGPGGR